MSLTAGTIFAVQASATTGNINGAGFNTANANFPTNLAATVATSTAPVVTSASYNFVAGDVGAYVYIKSGTNWTPGWYPIASVAANAATLNAAVGAVILTIGTSGLVTLNTVAGCATVASPTSGTFGVDYSQQDTANSSVTDLASVGASTTITSVSNPWSPVSVGNFLHITTTGTGAHMVVGWYEIVSESGLGSVVLDRTPNDGTSGLAATGQTGGAGRLNALEDTFNAMLPASSLIWVKNGAYTFSGAVSTANTNAANATATNYIGYNAIRGDTCVGANRPVFTMGANIFGLQQDQNLNNIILTGTGTSVVTQGLGCKCINCKITNTSVTASRNALNAITTGSCSAIECELVSQNGAGYLTTTSLCRAIGCYIHDCGVQGLGLSATGFQAIGNILAGNAIGINNAASSSATMVIGNTIYGRAAKFGTGLANTQAAAHVLAINNIFSGLVTGISTATGVCLSNVSEYNDFFNNTTDATNWNKSALDLAVNPQFANASELTGTTATTSGSVLTDSGANFSGVNDNIDYLHITSGTGVTVAIYLITGHTGTTLTTNNALGTSSGGDVVYWVSNGHNFQIGANLKAVGFPNFSNATGGLTVGYPDVGAVQEIGSSTVASTFSG